jgi:hypothetical protein
MISRAQWGARAPKHTPTPVAISARTATAVHHDGANPVVIRSLTDAYALMRRDQNYHMDHNGWDDIGYNFLVISAPGYAVDGFVLEGRGRDVVGAHCLNWNTPWIGVQVAVGGAQVPSPKALSAVRALHDGFVKAAGHSLGMKGHKDGYNTACPGPLLYAWVRAGMPVAHVTQPLPGPASPPPPALIIPKFPLPARSWYGVRSSNPLNHSGYSVLDRPAIRKIQAKVLVAQTGLYDANTESHVERFQHTHLLVVDGRVGPKTWLALHS